LRSDEKMDAYKVSGLTKRFKQGNVLANDDLTFEIEEGEIFGLLGPNGAGKTTLIRQLMGLLPPTSGRIELFGIDVTAGNSKTVPGYVSYEPQRAGAVADLTAEEALNITGRLRGQKRPEAASQARELIEEFHLGSLGKRPIGKLSGGEQRLVCFCMALMTLRPILMLDEPTNDLDPLYRKQVWDKILDVNRERGTTVVLVTHNVVEAEKVLRRVGIINQGKIQVMGTVGALKARVDQRVRLDVRLAPYSEDRLVEDAFAGFGRVELRPLGKLQWLILVDKPDVQAAIDRLMSFIGLERVDDLRVLTPTLEDVYIQLGGGERLVAP
jgi:ABC-type multidrug transport system ATPase subunit